MAIETSIELVIFDLDGTLINLPINWEKIRQAAGVRDGQKLGQHIESLIRDNKDDLLDRITAVELEALDSSSPADYIYQSLSQLIERYKLAILTRNSRRVAEGFLDRIGLQGIYIIGREDVNHLKPHPEGLQKILEHFKTQPAHALFVGDTYHDVEAAHRAGLSSAIINNSKNVFQPKGADMYITTLSDLPAIIERQELNHA